MLVFIKILHQTIGKHIFLANIEYLIINMQEKQRKFINSYFNEAYITAVSNFESLVTQHIFSQENITISISSSDNQHFRYFSLNSIRPGSNQNTYTKSTVFRTLKLANMTYFLIADNIKVIDPTLFVCLAISGQKIGRQQVQYGMSIIVKEPYYTKYKTNQNIKLFLTRAQNVHLTGQPLAGNPQALKENGNLLFKQNRFYQALITYQLALTSIQDIKQCRLRSIIYSNSSACLSEIYLYQTSLKYADVAIKIDNSYHKSYIRKINNLLQLQKFSSVPKCLINLYQKIDANQIEIINRKYTNFVANSSGFFDWIYIFSKNGHKAKQFGQYKSKKIMIKEKPNQYSYYQCQEGIDQYQLILVSKPLIYFKSHDKFIEEYQKVSEEVSLYTSLQRSFYQDLKQLPCLCHQDTPLQFDQPLTKPELLRKMERTIFLQRYFEKMGKDIGYGVWKDMNKIKQSCQPNCSFVHFKSALAVFANRKIEKGQFLTVDLCADVQAGKRQAILQDKLGIKCQCMACDFKKWPPKYAGHLDGFLKVLVNLNTNKIRKTITWHVLLTASLKNHVNNVKFYYQEVFEYYLSFINESCSWEDILNILRIVRGEQQLVMKHRMQKTIQKSLIKFLQLDTTQVQALLSYII